MKKPGFLHTRSAASTRTASPQRFDRSGAVAATIGGSFLDFPLVEADLLRLFQRRAVITPSTSSYLLLLCSRLQLILFTTSVQQRWLRRCSTSSAYPSQGRVQLTSHCQNPQPGQTSPPLPIRPSERTGTSNPLPGQMELRPRARRTERSSSGFGAVCVSQVKQVCVCETLQSLVFVLAVTLFVLWSKSETFYSF